MDSLGWTFGRRRRRRRKSILPSSFAHKKRVAMAREGKDDRRRSIKEFGILANEGGRVHFPILWIPARMVQTRVGVDSLILLGRGKRFANSP